MYKLIFRAVRLSIHSCENIDKRKSSLRRGWLKSSWAGSIMRPIQGGFFRHAATLAVVLSILSVVTESTLGQTLQPSLSSETTRLVSFSPPAPDSNAGGLTRVPLAQNPVKYATAQDTALHHYEYVFPDGNIYVYDLDNAFKLVKHISVPTSAGVRGCVASAATGILYLSFGSDAAGGHMLAYDLRHDAVLWQQHYPFGIDSMAITVDGKLIYMPVGELASDGIWEVLDANTGTFRGSIDTRGKGPHNTVLSADGSHVYMGPRSSNYLVVADTANNTVIRAIGPVKSGVRPFTINKEESLAFITTSGFLGFQVGEIKTGRIIYTVPVRGFPSSRGAASAPSHGISLSPDEKEVYLIDSINSYVHVFDVNELPAAAPRQVADIKLVDALSGDERGCAYDCLKDGWIHHSRDGRYVLVGDSGDVISTARRVKVGTLRAMADTRKEIEIDFQKGAPVWAMNNRAS
jgi:DNA-binding beta-propeller fold protein YncE